MRAIVQSRYGAPAEVLQVADIPRPDPGPGEVLVRVRATAVHADLWHSITGQPYYFRMMLGLRGPKRPVPGTDLAGVVETVGAHVTRFQPGDEVFGATTRGFPLGNGGAFAEYAVAPEASLALKPANVTFEQASSVPASGYIAYSQLNRFAERVKGQKVLVNGAGGGVGSIALQILKAFGAHVTAVDASPKLAALRSLGADETIDYTRTNFLDQGIRYDLIFDVPSNITLDESLRALTPTGLYICIGHEHYGRAAGSSLFGRGMPQMFGLMMKAMFRHPNLPKMEFPPKIPTLNEAMTALQDWMAEGKLTPLIDRTYPLESFAEAFQTLEDGKVLGKVILNP